MAGAIAASAPSWTVLLSALNPGRFGELVTSMHRHGANAPRRGRPWYLGPPCGSANTPCSSWTTRWCLPVTRPSPNSPRTTGTPPTIRSSWSAGRPRAGSRNDSKALTIADGGYLGTGLVMPHRRRKGDDLPTWKQAHNKSHKQFRARVEHVFALMKCRKILRDCRPSNSGRRSRHRRAGVRKSSHHR